MNKYSQFQKAEAIPEASSMIETFRAIGYTIESAVADIVDNSISAYAKNIWISFDWKNSDTWLSIKDDGKGMNNDELILAMRPGSKHPFDVRDQKDLGRFGLGLKTASFSQCRMLTVISKKEDEKPVYWTWDLDFVNDTGKWELINYLPDIQFSKEIEAIDSGTIVIWNNLDRIIKMNHNETINLDKFLQIMENVKRHLSMVFHRFNESGKIKIWFQDRKVEPWNPFMEGVPSTQPFPSDPLHNGQVIVKGFVLPHKSKLTENVFREAEGPNGWNAQQGFYIYRNERMLLSGDWLGMFRKEEHYKLARIQVDIPNTMDIEWQIDIKKSVARPPVSLRDQLKAYAINVRSQAVEVYRHRGKSIRQLPGQKFVPLWIEHKKGDKWSYKINKEHPLIYFIKIQAKNDPDNAINTLIKFIEETIPAKSIYIKEAEEPEALIMPFEDDKTETIIKTIKLIFENLKNEGRTSEQAKSIILNIDPFNQFPQFIEFLE